MILLIYQLIISIVCLALHSQAKRVEVDWNIEHLQVNRDEYYTRKAVGVNGQLPVPPVYMTAGDTLVLNVCNSLDEPTAVHAHGIFHRGENYNDGAGMVTQCGIPSGTNYTYEYKIDQPGTYWLHGHYHHQNVDGLRTPLVVYDSNMDKVPITYDKDVLISLEDWYPVPMMERMKEVQDPTKPFPPPPSYPVALINGIDGNKTQAVEFEPGKKYRLRIVNIGSTEWFKFNIAGHKLTVIEADGVYSEPYDVDGLSVGPGQRYSVVVQAKPSVEFNYAVNITLFANFVPLLQGLNPRQYSMAIQYQKGAPTNDEGISEDQMVWADDIHMQAFDKQPLLQATRTVETTAGSKQYSDNVTRAFLRTFPYTTPPKVPTLFSALSTDTSAFDANIYGAQTEAEVIDQNDVVEIHMINASPIDHAMHLHGHTFQVTEYGPAGNNTGKATKCGKYPMRRDTFVVQAHRYIKVRFLADNPGVWLFHCHMDIHFALGLAMTFIEAPGELQRTQKVPEELKQMCLKQGLGVSGNAAGNLGLDMTGFPEPPH